MQATQLKKTEINHNHAEPKPLNGQLFSLYQRNYVYQSEQARESASEMHLNLKGNTFAKYRDMSKRIVYIQSKLPHSIYANVIKLKLTVQVIQASEPIDLDQEIFYFEIKILHQGGKNQIMIGISEKDYPLNKQLGSTKLSYGFKADGKIFHNKATGSGEDYGSKFDKGDVVGCGLVLSTRQIFFTLNGRYLGIAFKDVELVKGQMFASICLQSINDEVSVKFQPTSSLRDQFSFDLEDYRNEILKKEYLKVQAFTADRRKMHEIVKSYLVHYGYVETLQAIEEPLEPVAKEEQKDDKIPIFMDRKLTEDVPLLEQKGRLISDVSIDDQPTLMLKSARSESFSGIGSIGQLSSLISLGRRINRSESLYVPPNISDRLVEKVQKQKKGQIDEAVYLKERGTLRHMLSTGEIFQAKQFFKDNLAELYQKNITVRALFDALEFIGYIANGETDKAVEFASENFTTYLKNKRKVTIPTKDLTQPHLPATIGVTDLMGLLCYQEPETSELRFLLTNEQTALIIDALNNQIIKYGNKEQLIARESDSIYSRLENVFQQLEVCQSVQKEKNCNGGKRFKLTL